MGWGFLLLLLLIIGNLGALVSPYFLKIIIDRVFPYHDYELLIQILVMLLAVYVIRVMAIFLSDYLFTWISNKITVSLTTTMFDHIIRLPITYFKQNSVGDIVYRINNEIGQVRRAFTGSIINMVNNVITVVALIVLMSILQARLFLVVAVMYPFLALIINRFSPWIKKVVEKTRHEESDILAYLTERFSIIKSIKLLDTFSLENALMRDKINNLVRSNQRTTVLTAGANSLSIFLLAIIPLVVLAYGGSLVLDELMTVGTLIAFLQYANKLHEPFKTIVNLYGDLIKTSVSLRRIFELLAEPIQFGDRGRSVPHPVTSIRFDRVCFEHGDKVILRDASFTIDVGKHYALVGPSGGGKTTIVDLLCKFYQPSSGNIWVNDVSLKDIWFEDWMKVLSASGQGYLLLRHNVRENLRYGNPDVTDAEIDEILRHFRLFSGDHDTRLASEVGEEGGRLSGGQRQKIAIARSVLRRPHVLILDEATSEIDSRAEAAILDRLFSDEQFRTIVMVSHRVSSLKWVDEILYVDQGKILERGSFAELIARREYFYHLFEHQLQHEHITVS